MTALPKPDTSLPGASCLLCIAVASAANSSLTAHTKTLGVEDLPDLKKMVADRIRASGAEVVVIEETLDISTLADSTASGPNMPRKNFAPLKQKFNVDRLLVLNIAALGFERTYSAYVPTSEPKAMVRGSGFLVNLSNNTYEWFLPLNVLRAAEGKWDEPPKFPGLTNAYFQAIELGKDELQKPFAK
ncbi:hypothetical protein IP84_09005 [beta proteobacterium AAP99]|nr:hypothetical protein IP84_09005 [beta proteobacterium AAP99]